MAGDQSYSNGHGESVTPVPGKPGWYAFEIDGRVQHYVRPPYTGASSSPDDAQLKFMNQWSGNAELTVANETRRNIGLPEYYEDVMDPRNYFNDPGRPKPTGNGVIVNEPWTPPPPVVVPWEGNGYVFNAETSGVPDGAQAMAPAVTTAAGSGPTTPAAVVEAAASAPLGAANPVAYVQETAAQTAAQDRNSTALVVVGGIIAAIMLA